MRFLWGHALASAARHGASAESWRGPGACHRGFGGTFDAAITRKEMTMELTSTSFTHGGEIPQRCTCEGEDTSPPLAWSGVPPNAKSLALIVDDPDAPDPAKPQRTWVHWVLVDIPADAGGLPGGGQPLPAGTREGTNDWNRKSYGGPCPPVGRHRYFFKLYALDTRLPQLASPKKAELELGMQNHVVARAELMGTYQKKKSDR